MSPNERRSSRQERERERHHAVVSPGGQVDGQEELGLQPSHAAPEGRRDGGVEERRRSGYVQGSRKLPMFQVPADPIVDAEMGGMR